MAAGSGVARESTAGVAVGAGAGPVAAGAVDGKGAAKAGVAVNWGPATVAVGGTAVRMDVCAASCRASTVLTTSTTSTTSGTTSNRGGSESVISDGSSGF